MIAPLSPSELTETLATIEEDNMIWRAVHTLLSEMYRDDIQSVTTPGLSDGDRQFAAGKLFRSSDTCEGLLKLWRESKK